MFSEITPTFFVGFPRLPWVSQRVQIRYKNSKGGPNAITGYRTWGTVVRVRVSCPASSSGRSMAYGSTRSAVRLLGKVRPGFLPLIRSPNTTRSRTGTTEFNVGWVGVRAVGGCAKGGHGVDPDVQRLSVWAAVEVVPVAVDRGWRCLVGNPLGGDRMALWLVFRHGSPAPQLPWGCRPGPWSCPIVPTPPGLGSHSSVSPVGAFWTARRGKGRGSGMVRGTGPSAHPSQWSGPSGGNVGGRVATSSADRNCYPRGHQSPGSLVPTSPPPL